MDLQQQLLTTLNDLRMQHPQCRGLLIALSGGQDSMVLLHACHRLKSELGLSLRAIHVNHGLNEKADDWTKHCQQACEERGIELAVHRLTLRRVGGESLEAVAREARYAAFTAELTEHEVLVTAHHQSDQAETVLLQLMRGSGLRGLSGMPACRDLGSSQVWRPLLSIDADRISAYALDQTLQWVEDSSNADINFSRNYLRACISPLLDDRWPGWERRVAGTAELCADADLLLHELASGFLAEWHDTEQCSLQIPPLQQLTSVRQRLVLRHWLWEETGSWPSRRLLGRIESEVIAAGEDRQPLLRWQGREIRRYRESLYLCHPLPVLPPLPADGLVWRSEAGGRLPVQVLPANGTLRWYRVDAAGTQTGGAKTGGMQMPSGDCRITYRTGGEQCTLAGRPQRSLKKVLHDAGVLPWLRDRTPLLWVDGRLAYVAQVGVCEGFQVPAGSSGWAPGWQLPPPFDD